MAYSEGIRIKKKHGQHFLRDQSIVDSMIDRVQLTPGSSIFEIGCGDGFLTQALMRTKAERVYVFEIDPEWATYVSRQITDKRLTVFERNFLDLDRAVLGPHAPWTVLANLPYNVTFPILHYFQRNRDLLAEGVVMVQEEVAQKLVAQRGKGYGFISLFFQHYFALELLNKIAPTAFFPPPKVFSRLVYFRPRKEVVAIPEEERFWAFIKHCFKQPRRTLYNNIKHLSHISSKIDQTILALRAQQMSMQDFLRVWQEIR